jgi:hypothetical protein
VVCPQPPCRTVGVVFVVERGEERTIEM